VITALVAGLPFLLTASTAKSAQELGTVDKSLLNPGIPLRGLSQGIEYTSDKSDHIQLRRSWSVFEPSDQ
jgi:hypothetical protein